MKKRNYKLSKEQVENILKVAKETNSFPNPYKDGTSYATIVNVLFYLGLNQFHKKEDIEEKFVQFFGNEITLKENWQNKLLTNIKRLWEET